MRHATLAAVLAAFFLILSACTTPVGLGAAGGDGPGARTMDGCSACDLAGRVVPTGAETAAGAAAEGGVRQAQAPFIADRVPLRPNTKVGSGSGDFTSEDTTHERRELASGGNQYVGTVNFTPTLAAALAGGSAPPNAAVRALEARYAALQRQADTALNQGNLELYKVLRDDLAATEDKLATAVTNGARTVSYTFNLDGSRNVPFGVSNAKTGDQPGADPSAVQPVAGAVGEVTRAAMEAPAEPARQPAQPDSPSAAPLAPLPVEAPTPEPAR